MDEAIVSEDMARLPADAIRGVTLGLHLQPDQGDYRGLLWEIARLGASHVAFPVQWVQRDIRASEVDEERGPATPPEVLTAAIRQAHALGLAVMLLPVLWIEERGPGEWRGVLAPSSPDVWWDSWRARLVALARLAESEDVEMLAIGSELGSLEGARDAWHETVRQVRAHYRGRLVYSANWDHHERTLFWDAVDVMGISSYQELSSVAERVPGREELRSGWAPHLTAIHASSRRWSRPWIMSEVGYLSQRGTTARPWDHTLEGAPDPQEQWVAWQAACEAAVAGGAAGLFVWNWFGDGGALDNGYTPRQKPAESVLRRCFSHTGGEP
jgi:hypothetical protein